MSVKCPSPHHVAARTGGVSGKLTEASICELVDAMIWKARSFCSDVPCCTLVLKVCLVLEPQGVAGL